MGVVLEFKRREETAPPMAQSGIYQEPVMVIEENTFSGQWKSLLNNHCKVIYNPTAAVAADVLHGEDYDDKHNCPAFYAETKRSHKKAAAALREKFTKDTTMRQAVSILQESGIRVHTWCTMD